MPLREYDDIQESPGVGGTPVIVKIHSSQIDMTDAELFGSAVHGEDCFDNAFEDVRSGTVGSDMYILTAEGVLSTGEQGRISLSYEEAGTDEIAAGKTEISFIPSDPGCITVEKQGETGYTFTVEKERRHYNIYETDYGTFEMCTLGKKIDNRLTENGGILILDYAVELKGLTAQRTKMRIDVKVI